MFTCIATVDPEIASRPVAWPTCTLKLYRYVSRPRREKACCALPTVLAPLTSFLISAGSARSAAWPSTVFKEGDQPAAR